MFGFTYYTKNKDGNKTGSSFEGEVFIIS